MALRARLQRALREARWRFDPWRLHSRVLARNDALAALRSHTVAVFNHFDPDGRVAGYVLHHLDALRALDARIVFVTTSPQLSAAALDALRPRCWLVLQRPNVSLDLGGWPVAAAAVWRLTGQRVAGFQRWLFTNDSIFGPLTPLAPVFAEMAGRAPDAWGMTESLERQPHLQSYFIVFERPALAFLQRWLDGFRFILEREALIARYELGLSVALREAGLRAEAFVPAARLQTVIATVPRRAPDKLHAADGRFLGNPTHWYWRECLQPLGMPYVKRDLLQRRRGLATLTDGWRDQLQASAPVYPLQLIDEVLPAD
ncbi:rhamnan synthesis F family protein [Pelomonas cellulosilytica]|uniref:Rhamnan synthesis protein F n=1 Tax=Pelomonas cellulosilytica TaxID=2906762 RepID=A0ABS8XY34_9BURK|nr:rhamnan synthesis F family protein [Pelomonas sp. P8]MCE4557567.1 hypothetical protein [Pelomonas sp. P8]